MWKAETRRTYDRKGLRYPSDVTDAEWDLARPSHGHFGVKFMSYGIMVPPLVAVRDPRSKSLSGNIMRDCRAFAA
jgi:hypothetical protein